MHQMFDRVAEAVSHQVERPWFFSICFIFVVGWAFFLPFKGVNNPVVHLWLNSPTTSVTFLLVALLQNTQARSTRALQRKLDAALLALAEIVDNTDSTDANGECSRALREMVGTEMEPSE